MGAHHHVVADRQTEPGSLSRRLCREKGLPCPASPPECRRRCRGCGSRLRLPSSLVLTCNSGENAGVDCVLAVRQCSSQTHPTPGDARNPTFPSLITLASAQTCPTAATPSRLGTSCIEAVQGVPKKAPRRVSRRGIHPGSPSVPGTSAGRHRDRQEAPQAAPLPLVRAGRKIVQPRECARGQRHRAPCAGTLLHVARLSFRDGVEAGRDFALNVGRRDPGAEEGDRADRDEPDQQVSKDQLTGTEPNAAMTAAARRGVARRGARCCGDAGGHEADFRHALRGCIRSDRSYYMSAAPAPSSVTQPSTGPVSISPISCPAALLHRRRQANI